MKPMKLLLTSGGFTNKTIARALLDLAGKPFSKLKLAFIPTAANADEGHKGWFINDLYRTLQLGFAEIDIVDISALPETNWKPRLEKADILMFSGGNTYHLMKWLRKTGLDKMLPKLLKTRVYVGISAGSIATGKSLALNSHSLTIWQKTGKLSEDKTLGWVNLHFRPHLNSSYRRDITLGFLAKVAKVIKGPIYALDNDSAIVVDGKKIAVVSEGVWKRFN